MKKYVFSLLVPLTMAAQTAAPDAVHQWIRDHAIKLTTPVAGHGFDDMQPLKKVVGDARIVALGEATHGTREFFQMKHRMLEYLATQMGFTIFSIEASMPEAYKLNDYVLEGKGDPVALIKGMYFWTWDTQEVLEMVQWMREFNKSGKGRVEFTGFDMQYPNVAGGIVRDYVAKAEPAYAATVSDALKLAQTAATGSQAFGTANGTFPIAAARGKTLHFSGYIKTKDVSGYAGFWWRADGHGKSMEFRNLGAAAPKNTADWKKYEIEIPIPEDADAIYWGCLLSGSGSAWYDDLKIEIDGKPYELADSDFTFEGSKLKGLNATMMPYQSLIDGEVAHGGKQSLRLSRAATAAGSAPAADPKTVAAKWKEIVAHLEKAEKPDAWAIQNARVVVQCMQSRANEVMRDASMAANVKWILGQNPKAKIVLWAHNGHVETSGWSMGTALRKEYGDKMVVFGFAFDHGSFQAIPQSMSGPLRDFTVPPAKPGMLDAALAASGIPLFALDLRNAPQSGVVADWLKTAHGTRSIGAVYPEDQDYAFVDQQVAPERADVLLFVNTTTAARKNGPLKVAGVTKDADGAVTFRDVEVPVIVKLPKDWTVGAVTRFGEHENTATLMGPDGRLVSSLYFVSSPRAAATAEEQYKKLESNVEAKAKQRVAQGVAGFTVRPDSIVRRRIGGRPAVSCVGEFTVNGQPMVEYLTWVRGENATAMFFARIAPGGLDGLRELLDPVIETVSLP